MLAWMDQPLKSVVLNSIDMSVCILKGTDEIIISGRIDLGIHSLEKLIVNLEFEKCSPAMKKNVVFYYEPDKFRA